MGAQTHEADTSTQSDVEQGMPYVAKTEEPKSETPVVTIPDISTSADFSSQLELDAGKITPQIKLGQIIGKSWHGDILPPPLVRLNFYRVRGPGDPEEISRGPKHECELLFTFRKVKILLSANNRLPF